MKEQGYLQRPIVLALAGAVLFSAAYYAYHQYSSLYQPHDAQFHSLHRSNAIRRRRRRQWRRGFPAIDLDYDPTKRALSHLRQRNEDRQGYGDYQNSYLFREPENIQGLDRRLIPCNLDPLYDALARRHPEWSPYQQNHLRLHVHGLFVQNFLREEYPEGYIIGDEEVHTLISTLGALGIDEEMTLKVVEKFDEGEYPLSELWSPHDEPGASPRMSSWHADGAPETWNPRDVLHELAGRRADEDRQSEVSFSRHGEDDQGGSQNMLDLLYHIAGEQARREGYIHRGVECNRCGVHPIQGIRYHCANCFDYDLCESCEADQFHTKSHVFYKIRIPAPTRGNIKQVSPKWYPGNPNAFPPSLPRPISKHLQEMTGVDRTEMDTLYEQFKCLAGQPWPSDPTHLGMAIDRRGFDMYFIPTTSDRPSPANLIYDRLFAFYDTNHDGLIGFQEFICGLADLQDKSRMARLKRIFRGYDLDGDDYVNRQDFLRMFRAYYALNKELSREMVNSQEDFGYIDEEIREVVQGSQPISAAFGGNILFGHESRPGQDKQPGANGDLDISAGPNGVLQNDLDLRGDHARAIGNAAIGDRTRTHPFRTFRTDPPADEPVMHLHRTSNFELLSLQHGDDATEEELAGPDPPLQAYGWPPLLTPEPEDITEALGQSVPFEDITDPVDRSRVLYAQSQRLDAECDRFAESSRRKALHERWRRRQFYLDEEEGMTKPPGYTEPDSSDEDDDRHSITTGKKKKPPRLEAGASSSRQRSTRSRSSSKVRFDDSAIDTDYETRSNTSSRSIPVNERWGGFELGHPDPDIAKDVLYQAVQQGFNELLDTLFKAKEDEAMEALRTRSARLQYADELDRYEKSLTRAEQVKDEALRQADMLRTEEILRSSGSTSKEQLLHEHDPQASDASPKPLLDRSEMRASPDPTDHIELMFGGNPATPAAQLETLNGRADVESTSSDSWHDPTLPQFRPDEAEENREQRRDNQPYKHNTEVYDKWLRHKRTDKEAQERGGYAKLSFKEFRRKMVLEDDVANALGPDEDVDIDDDSAIWERSAELGKLAFVGTWLEMANF